MSVVPLAWADPDETGEPCPGYTYLDGIGRACPQPDGTYMVMSPDGEPLGPVTHTDPVPTEPEPVLMLAASDVQCVTSSEQYAIWVIYARASNDADGYSANVNKIRYLVAQSQQLVSDAATATGGTSKLEVLCNGSGQVDVKNEVLPTSLSGDNFDTIVDDLQNKGYNDDDKKYWVYYDDTGACSCAGTGHFYPDDSNSSSNYNNGNYPDPFFAVTFGYNSTRTWLHELSHTLGAVQHNAPYASGAGHCVDGKDILCYDDNGPNTGSCVDFYCTGTCSVEVWDCNRNSYYNLNPAASAWLATHWNIGRTYVRYLVNVLNLAPTMTSLSCSPTSGLLGDTVNCSFTATDTSDQLAYNVNWGDGATERVPATGYVASGTTRTASRMYPTDGVYTIRVTATDNNPSTALTSAALTSTVSIQAAPVMELLSCSPNPTEVERSTTCSVRARDNSTGVFYTIGWGDGSPTTRIPATGTVTPGTTRTATHVWSAVGNYTVSANATDNGAPALSSTTLTLGLSVLPNAAPVMTSLGCAPNPVQAENPTTCTFVANDLSAGVAYTVDWGDGSAPIRVPATGVVAPGTSQQASHVYATDGTYTMSVSATDNGSPPLGSTAMTLDVQVTPANVAPTMVSASCDLKGAGAATTCIVKASDSDSTGVSYRIEWGDGTVSTLPTSGYAPAGTNQSAQHTYALGGVYKMNVTATDNGSPARTSSIFQIDVTVGPDGVGPVLELNDPRPHRLYQGCGIQTDVFVGDPVYFLVACVKASVTDPSGVANVTALINGVVAQVDTTAPYTLEFPVPRARPDSTLTVIAYDTYGNPRSVNVRVDLL